MQGALEAHHRRRSVGGSARTETPPATLRNFDSRFFEAYLITGEGGGGGGGGEGGVHLEEWVTARSVVA
jgi:hypothetical protein